jgi:hypothetical protein
MTCVCVCVHLHVSNMDTDNDNSRNPTVCYTYCSLYCVRFSRHVFFSASVILIIIVCRRVVDELELELELELFIESIGPYMASYNLYIYMILIG